MKLRSSKTTDLQLNMDFEFVVLAELKTLTNTWDPTLIYKLSNDVPSKFTPDAFVYGSWEGFLAHFNITPPNSPIADHSLLAFRNKERWFLVLKRSKFVRALSVEANTCKIAVELGLPILYFETGQLNEFCLKPIKLTCAPDMRVVDIDCNFKTNSLASFEESVKNIASDTYIHACSPNSGGFLLGVDKKSIIKLVPKRAVIHKSPFAVSFFETESTDTYLSLKTRMLEQIYVEPSKQCQRIFDYGIADSELMTLAKSLDALVYNRERLEDYLLENLDIVASTYWKFSSNPLFKLAYAILIKHDRVTYNYFTYDDWYLSYLTQCSGMYMPIMRKFFTIVEDKYSNFVFDSKACTRFAFKFGTPIINERFEFVGFREETFLIDTAPDAIFLKFDMLTPTVGWFSFIESNRESILFFSTVAATDVSGARKINTSFSRPNTVTNMCAYDSHVYFIEREGSMQILKTAKLNTGHESTLGSVDGEIIMMFANSEMLQIFSDRNAYSLKHGGWILNMFSIPDYVFYRKNHDILAHNNYIDAFLSINGLNLQQMVYTDYTTDILFLSNRVHLKNFVFIKGDIYFYRDNIYIKTSGFKVDDAFDSKIQSIFTNLASDFDSNYCNWIELLKLVFKKYKFAPSKKVDVFVSSAAPNIIDRLAQLNEREANVRCLHIDTFELGKSTPSVPLIDIKLELSKLSPIQLFTFGNGNIIPKIITMGGLDKSTIDEASSGAFMSSISIANIDPLFLDILASIPEVTIVGIVGQQSGGKSYLLNRMFNTMFDVAAARCTDGAWATISHDKDTDKWFLVIDCEGLFSSMRDIKEELKLLAFLSKTCHHVLFNTSVSNNRTYFELINRVAQLLPTLVHSSECEEKAVANFVIRDLKDTEAAEPCKELGMTINKNLPAIRALFKAVKIFYLPNFAHSTFEASVTHLKSLITSGHVPRKNPEHLAKWMGMLLAQLYVNDNVDIKVRIAEAKLAAIKIELRDKLLDDGKVDLRVRDEDVLKQFYLLFTFEKNIEPREFGSIKWSNDELDEFDQFIQTEIDARTKSVSDQFKIKVGELELPQEEISGLISMFAARVKISTSFLLCKQVCRYCTHKCMKFKRHDQECSCLMDHLCREACSVCPDKLCSLTFGHASAHLCAASDHFCNEQCSKCLNSCKLFKNHPPGTHTCLDRHLCEYTCDAPCCTKICVLNSDEPHEKHICNLNTCRHKCRFDTCDNLCAYPDHFHLNDSDAIYPIPETWSGCHSKVVDYHICDRETHACENKCALPGAVCSIDYERKELVSFRGVKFEVIVQKDIREPCKYQIGKYNKDHVEPHLCLKVEHRCQEQCPDCLAYCDQDNGHSALHSCKIHRNKDQCVYVLNESAESGIVSNDEGQILIDIDDKDPNSSAMETCTTACHKLGRGHLHAISCVCPVIGARVERITDTGECQICKRAEFMGLMLEGVFNHVNFIKCTCCKGVAHYECLDTSVESTFRCRTPGCYASVPVESAAQRRTILIWIYFALKFPKLLTKKWSHKVGRNSESFDAIPCLDYFEAFGWQSPMNGCPETPLCDLKCSHFAHDDDTASFCSLPVLHEGDHVLSCRHEEVTTCQVAIVCDATGSMHSYMSAAVDLIDRVLNITLTAPQKFEFAIVFYRDHPPQDREFVTKILDFSTDLDEIKEFRKSVEAGGGGDGPEAVLDGLRDSLRNLSWNKGRECWRTVVLLADAPPHGYDLYGWHSSSWDDGCPCNTTFERLGPEFKVLSINLKVIRLSSGVEKMAAHFKNVFKTLKMGSKFESYTIKSPARLIDDLAIVLTKSLNADRELTKIDLSLLTSIDRHAKQDYSDLLIKDKKRKSPSSSSSSSDDDDDKVKRLARITIALTKQIEGV